MAGVGLENLRSIPIPIPLPQGSGSTSPSAPLASLVSFLQHSSLRQEGGVGVGVFRTQSAQGGERGCASGVTWCLGGERDGKGVSKKEGRAQE